MRRELARGLIALVISGAVAGCGQSADDRSRHAAERVREQALVRETPTVERVTIPSDSGRLIYDPPPDLSATSPGRPGVAINGADTSSLTRDSAQAAARNASPPT